MPLRLAPFQPLLPLVAALFVYAWLWPLVTPDMTQSYGPWLEHVEAVGPINAIGHPFGDYTPPFVYLLALASLAKGWLATATLVKLVSVSGTAVLAVAVGRLLRALGTADPWIWAAFVPLLPGVALNASLLASGDALWAAPCVLAVGAAVERRWVAMLAWWGLALAVKQQAISLAPFMLGLLLGRQVPLRLWLVAPAAYLACFVPAFLAGAPIAGVVGIYARQASFFDALSLNAPNLWAIVERVPGTSAVPLTGLALAAATGAGAWLAARVTALRPDGSALLAAALASPLLVIGLLPRMHERYFFLADVLAFAWAAAAGTRIAWTIAALVQAGSALGVLAYLTGTGALAALGALPMLIATARVVTLLRPARAANDNPLALA